VALAEESEGPTWTSEDITSSLCVLKVVDSEGGIHPVAIPTCDQLHASQFHVIDGPDLEHAPPQAMLYQALFGGTTERHGHGFSKKVFRA
jgi:hypothetical protein